MRKAIVIGFILVIAAAVVFGVASLASGASRRSAGVATVAYEPFCYAANGSLGNGGSGWNGGWAGNGALVNTLGLSFSAFPGSGCSPNNSLGTTPGSAANRALSSLVQPGSGTSGVILRALIRSNIAGTPGTQATLGNSSGGTLTIGDLPVSDPLGGNWGIQVNGGATDFSTVAVQANVTTALTVEVDFGAGVAPGNQDRVRLWVQTSGAYCGPPVGSCTADLDLSAPAMNAFSGVFWKTQGQGALVDEISVDKITSTGQICVLKYEDKNGNGTQQFPLEGNLAHWTINVTAGPSAPFPLTTATKPSCRSVNPGTYTLTEVQKAGWIATVPATGTQTATVTTGVTTIVKFGNKKKGRPCRIKVGSFLAGKKDNFSPSNDLEPATNPLFPTVPAQSYFDQTAWDTHFWQEFRLNQLNPTLRRWVFCRATLEIRVKPLLGAPPGGRSGNDAIELSTGTGGGTKLWGQYFSEGAPGPGNPFAHFGTATRALLSRPLSIWEKPHPPITFTWTWDDLNLGLPAGASGTDLPLAGPQLGTSLFTKFKSNPHVLDVYVEDDTSVDYIKLTVWR